MAADPRAGRPYMPGNQGMHRSDSRSISWPTALQRFNACRNDWLATVRPDGRPHSMPVWGLWHEGAFWFSTFPASRKARNLAADGRCTVSTDQATEAVVIEGTAAPVSDVEAIRRVLPAYESPTGSMRIPGPSTSISTSPPLAKPTRDRKTLGIPAGLAHETR
jgi:hypothetical protein